MSRIGIDRNDPLSILSGLNDIDMFSMINKKHKQNIKCNLLLLKILDDKNNPKYGVHEIDNFGRSIIKVPSKTEIFDLNSMLLLYGTNVCNHDIGGPYLKESFNISKISFVLFSKSLNERTDKFTINICGLLFLDIINRKTKSPQSDIYIKLVCAESKSKSETVGMGTKFLGLTEKIGKIFNCARITLSSVDTPLGFYIAKQFKPIKGTELYEIPDGIKIPAFKRNKMGQNPIFSDDMMLQKGISKKVLFRNDTNILRTLKDVTRLLPKTNNNTGLRRSRRKNAGKKFFKTGHMGALQGVKIDDDGGSKMVMMEKEIIYDEGPLVAKGIENKKKYRRKSSKKFRKKSK